MNNNDCSTTTTTDSTITTNSTLNQNRIRVDHINNLLKLRLFREFNYDIYSCKHYLFKYLSNKFNYYCKYKREVITG